MPLRELPTEQDAAAALLRAERLRGRIADRKRDRLAGPVAVLAAAAVVALLLPGGRCALWRPDFESGFGRLAGLVLPAAVLVLVLAERAVGADDPWALRLRRWSAAMGVGYAVLVPAALARDGDDCGWTGAFWAALAIGAALAAVAIRWASEPPKTPDLTGSPAADADRDTPLNQPELRAVFTALAGELQPLPRASRRLDLVIGALAVVLALSLAGPWRELPVPQRLLGDLPSAFPGSTVWSLPGAGRLGWLLVLATAATVAAAVVPRARIAAGPLAAGTGALATAGWLTVVPQLPPTAPGGLGYRIAPAGWLALAAAVALCGCGVLAVLPSARRRLVAGTAALALLAGAGIALLSVDPPSYRAAPAGETVFEFDDDEVTDAAGLRLEIAGDTSSISAERPSPLAATLDGSPGHWFLGNLPEYRRTERIETATVFGWRDGIATAFTTLRFARIRLLGVVGDRMLVHAKGRTVDGGPEQWAVASIPLAMPYADVSLTSGTSDGRPWVSPGVTVLIHGTADQVEVSPAGNGAIAGTATTRDDRSGSSWLVPADVVRAGTPWTPDVLQTPVEAGATRLRVAPDGTVAWIRNGQLMTVRPGRRPRALVAATARCRRQPVGGATGSDLAYDDRGNLWLTARDRIDVITTDGVRRTAPLDGDRIRDLEPGPDGSLLVTGGDRAADSGWVRRIPGASRAAPSYPPMADPELRCGHETTPPTTTGFTATAVDRPPVVEPPEAARGQGRWSGGLFELVTHGGRLAFMQPAGTGPAPDGEGGLWWLRLPPRSDDFISTETVRAVHVRADGSVTSTDASVTLRRVSGIGRGAALGDRYAYLAKTLAGTTGAQYGYLDVTGRTGRQRQLADEPSWAGVSTRSAAWAGAQLILPVGTGLARVNPDGSSTTLLGGRPSDDLVPIAEAVARGLGRDQYSFRGQWFTGPDRAVWGYDGWYLYRLDAAGRVTVLGGQDQGLPVAADRVTVIGPDLYFEVGLDVVKVTPKGAGR
jgi:hypothetical protein